MKALVPLIFIIGCQTALPKADTKDITYNSLKTVDEMVPKLRLYALECKQDLEESRAMMAEISDLKAELETIKKQCGATRSMVYNYEKKLKAMAEEKKEEEKKEEESGPEYSPSDAPLE